MNIKYLKLTYRLPPPFNGRAVRFNRRDGVLRGLGQMQPVIITHKEARVEGVSGGRPCWWVYPLPARREEAKRAITHVIESARLGRKTSAALAYERGIESGQYRRPTNRGD